MMATRCTSECSSVDRARDSSSHGRGFDSRLTHPRTLNPFAGNGRKPRGSNPPFGCTSAFAPGGTLSGCVVVSRTVCLNAHRDARTARDVALRTGLARRRQALVAAITGGEGAPAARWIEIVIVVRAPRDDAPPAPARVGCSPIYFDDVNNITNRSFQHVENIALPVGGSSR